MKKERDDDMKVREMLVLYCVVMYLFCFLNGELLIVKVCSESNARPF